MWECQNPKTSFLGTIPTSLLPKRNNNEELASVLTNICFSPLEKKKKNGFGIQSLPFKILLFVRIKFGYDEEKK